MEDKCSDELDNPVSIRNTFFDREDTVDHVNEPIIESFLARQPHATRWDLFPNIRCLTMNFGESDSILLVICQ
jgi:hypothetical protein